jgi:hypothetical protein
MINTFEAGHGLDHAHDPHLRSWVLGADQHSEFPIQNLPLGIFPPCKRAPRKGIGIGDHILDQPAVLAAKMLSGEAASAAEIAEGSNLNALLALGAGHRRALRGQLSELLRGSMAKVWSRVATQNPASALFIKFIEFIQGEGRSVSERETSRRYLNPSKMIRFAVAC